MNYQSGKITMAANKTTINVCPMTVLPLQPWKRKRTKNRIRKM